MEEGGRRLERKRFESATLLTLKILKGATSQGIQLPLEGEKGKEMTVPLESPGRMQLC